MDRRSQYADANLSSTWLGDSTCFQTKDVGRLTDRVRDEGLHGWHRLHSSFRFSTVPELPCCQRSARGSQYHLHLRETAIHEQLRSRDVAAVVGCEKHHGFRDLVGCPESAQRNTAGNDLHVFLGRFYGVPWGRVGKARAHRVHANAASLQIHCPYPCERTDRGFGGAINTPVGQPFTGDDGRIQDDRGTIRQERKRLLHREQEALHIDVEERVVILRSYLAQGGDRRDAGIRKHNIEPALLPLDLCEQAI